LHLLDLDTHRWLALKLPQLDGSWMRALQRRSTRPEYSSIPSPGAVRTPLCRSSRCNLPTPPCIPQTLR
jgi:hypothetical protein